MLIGLDATLHLAEECKTPTRTVPKAIIATIGIGSVTAFSFAIAMCYSLTDVESLLASPTG